MMLKIVVAIIITIAVLGAGGLMTEVGAWYRDLRKPSWNPPNWLFGPAWTLILGLVAWAGVLGWSHAPDIGDQLRIGLLFAANIALQIVWSPLFFKLKRPDWALFEVPFLWLSILALMIGLAPFSAFAVWLLLPYLLWVSFATVLNFVIVRMNAPFVARQRA